MLCILFQGSGYILTIGLFVDKGLFELRGEKVHHFLVLDTRLDKFFPGHLSVRVDVHLVENPLSAVLCTLLVANNSCCLLWPHHRVDGLDNPGHLRKIDPPVAVGIIHAESPVQFLFWSSTGGDADSKKKLFEVDEPVPVCVKRPKYVIAKVSGIATWETLTVDLHKGWRTEFPVWAVRYETFVPLLDRIFVIICIRLQERHIVFRKSFRPRSTLTHDSLFANWFPQKLTYTLSQSEEERLCRVIGQPHKRGGVSACKEGGRTGC